jgi:hypothetical protein
LKRRLDAVAWGLDTSPETMAITLAHLGIADREAAEELCRSVGAPCSSCTAARMGSSRSSAAGASQS